jgi:aldehyde dehydrogenase (NAD+)
MRDYLKFYIDGQWVDPVEPKSIDVINPASEKPAGRISNRAMAANGATMRSASSSK